jgi:hypothetical protein
MSRSLLRSDNDALLDFPDLDPPGDSSSPAEQLTPRPDVPLCQFPYPAVESYGKTVSRHFGSGSHPLSRSVNIDEAAPGVRGVTVHVTVVLTLATVTLSNADSTHGRNTDSIDPIAVCY